MSRRDHHGSRTNYGPLTHRRVEPFALLVIAEDDPGTDDDTVADIGIADERLMLHLDPVAEPAPRDFDMGAYDAVVTDRGLISQETEGPGDVATPQDETTI